MKKIKFIIIIFCIIPILNIHAQEKDDGHKTAFQKVINVPPVDIQVPAVVALPFAERVSANEKFLVHEVETDTYIKSLLNNNSIIQDSVKSLRSNPVNNRVSRMVDGSLGTYAEFPVSNNYLGSVTLILELDRPIKTSSLNVNLSEHVIMPLTVGIVSVRSASDPVSTTLVSEKPMTNTVVTFPETTSSIFEITFTYGQPLRISELNFIEKDVPYRLEQALRFLVQPNYSYNVYYDADRPVNVSSVEYVNLATDRGVLDIPSYEPRLNTLYIPADVDGDGVRDTLDNCVHMANSEQIDIDGNGQGDACDDFDKDGRINIEDNCVNQPNSSQKDEDLDGIGDACDDEESRFTERNPWIPWVGMGTAGTVILILFFLVARAPRREDVE